LGGTLYLGAGGVVMGWSPHTEFIAIINEHIDFWFMVRTVLDDGCVSVWKPRRA
jgi:hypothetical protein